MKSIIRQFILSIFLSFGLGLQTVAAGLNDFDVTNNVVGLHEFMSGGPSKDGIPSLDKPKFIPADEADFLNDDDKVVGLVINGQAKAYPIRILNWHEIVNDQLSDESVAVTWCPLTRSAVAFDRTIGGQPVEFGVSGLLYNSNVVMYDRHSQGLWSQLKTGGLTGKYADNELNIIPSEVINWKDWKVKHPQTKVLSIKTGHWRDYNRDPYADYHASDRAMFPAGKPDQRLPPKTLIVGVKVNGSTKAYPLETLALLNAPLSDKIGEHNIKISRLDGGAIKVQDSIGNTIPSIVAYWFAWSAFNQETLVY